MDRQLKATICFVDYGESKLNIRDAVAVIENYDRGFYLYISRCDPNAQNSLIPDWPVSEESGEFVFIEADKLLPEVNGSLSVYLEAELNDPLAKDASALYSFSIRTENSEDSPLYTGDITVVNGANNERYLLPSTARRARKPTPPRPNRVEEPAPAVQTAAPAAPAQKSSSGVFKWLAFAAGLLLIVVALIMLWQYVLRPLLSGGIGGAPAAEQTAPVQNEEEKKDESTDEVKDEAKDEVKDESKDENSAAENTEPENESKQDASAEAQENTETSNASQSGSEETSASDPLVVRPCDIKSSPDDKVLLDACVRSKPQDSVIYKLGQDALSENRCDLAKRIFTSVGRGGNKDAALLLGKLFDPNESSVTSSCFAKDGNSAVYWYEKAKEAGESVESDKALENLKNAK